MTRIEELLKELGVELTVDEHGLYTKKAEALAREAIKIVLSDNEEVFNLDWSIQKEMIKERFWSLFPYMKP